MDIVKRLQRLIKKTKAKKTPDPAEERERRREAHYMANFWNYDGSEQEEFYE